VEQPSNSGKGGVAYRVRRTSAGFRLVQQGVVLSEVLCQPGPTHSVFDVLAALAHVLKPGQPIGLLGFAGGSMLAPLRFLAPRTTVRAVDLDASGYDLFLRHCSGWAGDLSWKQVDAVQWLLKQQREFSVLIDDLSILTRRRVVKPDISTTVLPTLMRRKLALGGVVVSNLLRPVREAWSANFAHFTRCFATVRCVELDEFENRIVVAGQEVPPAQELGHRIRRELRRLRSRQADRVRVRSIR